MSIRRETVALTRSMLDFDRDSSSPISISQKPASACRKSLLSMLSVSSVYHLPPMMDSAVDLAARAARVPRLERAHVLAEYQPPDGRRRDPANWYPSFKACIDGLIDAGVLPDDDAAHLDGPDMRLGEPYPKGRLVLTVTELPGGER